MIVEYSLFDFWLYLLLYSFLGWGIEVCCIAVKYRHFVNKGLLNLPFNLPYGITAAVVMITLPTLHHNYVLQYVLIFMIFWIVWSLCDQFVKGVSHKQAIKENKVENLFSPKGFLFALVVSGIYLVLYLIVHPIIFSLVELMPDLLVNILVIVSAVLVMVDFISVLYTLRTNERSKGIETRKESTQRLADKLTGMIWRRLQKAYPGIQESEVNQSNYVFAKGICFDKLVWVFLVSSFLGALIEMLYCRVTADFWMNRSSVLYGTFSVVWGLGVVVLTITLQRFAGKEDRTLFLAGFVVGGAYEYFCSVFTEIVFGTVFWDYSEMPLNIGGRTNVLYCIFWGILAVVWIKVLYPPMERGIEKLPPLMGKILTWIVVVVMACNGVLTAGAMIRYTARQTNPEADNVIEGFLDSSYDDEWMEHRWPNMVVTE